MAEPFKLNRLKQCAKCPWRKDVDPFDIPHGYSPELHQSLSKTIAAPGSLHSTGSAMACHEHAVGEEVHCVGWLVNQLGPGNNIMLRLQMMNCENLDKVQTVGEQHARFEDTLPEDYR